MDAIITVSGNLGADVELTRPEWYELYRAAGHPVP